MTDNDNAELRKLKLERQTLLRFAATGAQLMLNRTFEEAMTVVSASLDDATTLKPFLVNNVHVVAGFCPVDALITLSEHLDVDKSWVVNRLQLTYMLTDNGEDVCTVGQYIESSTSDDYMGLYIGDLNEIMIKGVLCA
jgi:hypothetical protein